MTIKIFIRFIQHYLLKTFKKLKVILINITSSNIQIRTFPMPQLKVFLFSHLSS